MAEVRSVPGVNLRQPRGDAYEGASYAFADGLSGAALGSKRRRTGSGVVSLPPDHIIGITNKLRATMLAGRVDADVGVYGGGFSRESIQIRWS